MIVNTETNRNYPVALICQLQYYLSSREPSIIIKSTYLVLLLNF
jgi:hypothetical protein